MDLSNFEVPVEDRGSFVKFMAYLARADHEVTIDEKHTIDDIIYAWQLDEKEIEEVYGILDRGTALSDLRNSFKNARTPYLLIQELITLANIDGSYCDLEKKAVAEIADAIGVGEARVRELEHWVAEGIAWRQRGAGLLAPEGN